MSLSGKYNSPKTRKFFSLFPGPACFPHSERLIIISFSLPVCSPVQRARYVVFDEHVRLFDQLPHDRLAVRMPEVHAHAPLVPVQRDEVQAHAALASTSVAAHVHVRRPVTAAVVAGHRSLDFDHVRAHVGQHHSAVGARGHPAHVHHPDPVQRSGTEATAVARRSGQRPSSRRDHEDGRCRSVARSAKHFHAGAAANDPTPGLGYDPCDIIIVIVVVL